MSLANKRTLPVRTIAVMYGYRLRRLALSALLSLLAGILLTFLVIEAQAFLSSDSELLTGGLSGEHLIHALGLGVGGIMVSILYIWSLAVALGVESKLAEIVKVDVVREYLR